MVSRAQRAHTQLAAWASAGVSRMPEPGPQPCCISHALTSHGAMRAGFCLCLRKVAVSRSSRYWFLPSHWAQYHIARYRIQ